MYNMDFAFHDFLLTNQVTSQLTNSAARCNPPSVANIAADYAAKPLASNSATN